MSFQKATYAVAAMQLPFDEDVVKSAVKDNLSAKGYKDSRFKDFLVYRDVPLNGDSKMLSDAYFSIETQEPF